MQQYQLTFIDLALARNALRFGRFKLKSGRESPYFFNAGLFSDGEATAILGRCYAAALAEHHGRSVPFAFDRKESKDHGEGGNVVGNPLAGRVVIVDDVISDG